MRTYTIKTLKQSTYTIELDPSSKVAELKEAVLNKEKQTGNDISVSQIKLIFSGKILSDDSTLESYNIQEWPQFIVLMVQKEKKTASVATPVAAPAQPEAAPVPAVAAPAATVPVASTPATIPATAIVTSDRAFGDTSSFLSGEALQSSITNMVDMGFSRPDVERAMRAAFNNPDRAVDYLMTGIPAHLQAAAAESASGSGARAGGANTPAPQAAAGPAMQAAAPASQPTTQVNAPQNLFQLAQQQQQQQQNQHDGAGLGLGGGLGGLAGLAGAGSGPGVPEGGQMAQLRELVLQNPALMQPMLQQLAQSNPQIAQYLEQHPEALLQILAQVGGEGGDDDDLGGPGQLPPGAQVIQITPEERAAIERLIALGFTRDQVIEAYFACDKNEELAANYLFENSTDMMDQ